MLNVSGGGSEESGVPVSNRKPTGKLSQEEQRNLIRAAIAGGGQ